jgi:Uncharacterized protein conserved in bacteria (DUF2188)
MNPQELVSYVRDIVRGICRHPEMVAVGSAPDLTGAVIVTAAVGPGDFDVLKADPLIAIRTIVRLAGTVGGFRATFSLTDLEGGGAVLAAAPLHAVLQVQPNTEASGWIVKHEAATNVSSEHRTKKEAVHQAQTQARSAGATRVQIYRTDRTLQRELVYD